MHGAVKDCAAAHKTRDDDEGYGWLYAAVASELGAPDLMFANLETPIAPKADKGSKSFVFNAPVAAAQALQHAGVDIVSVANNHALDQGRAGLLETLDRLDEIKLPFVGGGTVPNEAGPRILEAGGLKIAFLGFAQFFNEKGNDCPAPAPPPAKEKKGEKKGDKKKEAKVEKEKVEEGPCRRAAVLDPDAAEAAVKAAAQQADAVVVSVHWGQEYAAAPRESEVAIAHRLAEAGALVILGHHPHVLQPLELYSREDGGTSLIAYSLGNFISNQSRNFVAGVTPEKIGATRDGALLRAEILRKDYGRGVSRVELGLVDFLPLWTDNDTTELDLRKNPKAKPTIRVLVIDRALADVRAELAALPDPLPKADEARYVRLKKREETLVRRKSVIAGVLGEDYLRELPAGK